MEVEVIVFGSLTEIFRTGSLRVKNAADTRELIHELTKQYPELAGVRYTMAVDRKTVSENTVLQEGSVVALLPPFSGG